MLVMKTLPSSLLFLVFLSLTTSRGVSSECPPIRVNGSFLGINLISSLTHPCRYDATSRPGTHVGPLVVKAKMFIYHLQMAHSTNVEFKVQMLLQLRWLDNRLSYKHLAETTELVSSEDILELIWFPNVFMHTEQQGRVTSTRIVNHLVTIKPQGEVLLSNRLRSQLLCQTEEGNFPFDHQTCQMVMDSWKYNVSEVALEWEEEQSVLLPSFSIIPEFNLIRIATTTSDNLTEYNEGFIHSTDVHKSSLVVTFYFARKFGFYFWNYYVPSVMLVVMSWWTFWIDPEVIPARVWLATSTMLGFFGIGAMNDAMPKLSQVKMNDIWFVGCSLFILMSLAEFSFVNLVHRQEKKYIPLKKASSKYILKSSLRTETLTWRARHKATSCPSSPELRRQRKNTLMAKRKQQKSVAFNAAIEELTADNKTKRLLMRRRQAFTGTHMTNVEMANWIDRRSRAVFPISFLVFNLVFWCVMFF